MVSWPALEDLQLQDLLPMAKLMFHCYITISLKILSTEIFIIFSAWLPSKEETAAVALW
jgi:hypothetical protein